MGQRVLFLDQQSWQAGAERVLDETLRALEPEVIPLVAFPQQGSFASELQCRRVETLLFPLGRYHSGPKSLGDMLAFPPRSLYCAFRLAQIIRRRQIQAVYINSPRCLIAGVLAAKFTSRPSLFHLHMTMTRRTDLLVAAWAARRVTRIIACSNAAATSLSEYDPQLRHSVKVIYNPVRKPAAMKDPSKDATGLAGLLGGLDKPAVGLVGRITPQKGHHVLLKAAARLARCGREIQLVFVGAPGPSDAEDLAYVQQLESMARQLNMIKRVHWAGYQKDPNPFYAAFDVLVIPSTVSEGLPLVALEAMQWGVPVIGSRIGGIPEVVSDGTNGFLTPPGDDAALATSLDHVLGRGELRARLREGARSSVDGRFTVEAFRNKIRRVIFELFQGFTPPSDGGSIFARDRTRWK
jgi:glycosyltransferase involved in cell wall biosynthesis